MVERTVSERHIGEAHPSLVKNSVNTSPNCRRLAFVARVGKKQFVVVDGQEQKQYDRIERGSLVFSPDSRRLAYRARAGGKRFVVVDGEDQKQCDEVNSLVFSPDSQRVAYVARSGKKRFVVLDGQEQGQYGRIEGLAFSLDSRRLAFVVRARREQFVVVDRQEQKRYEVIETGSLVFSPDSQRLAYLARSPGFNWVLVVDGQNHWVCHERVGSLVFSPDSQRMACVFLGKSQYVIVEGGGECCKGEEELDLSNDVQQRGYVTLEWVGEEFWVGDWAQGKGYNQVGELVFSPDSRLLAYLACCMGAEYLELFAVADGHEGKHYEDKQSESFSYQMGEDLVFSPDGQRLAYVIMVDGNVFVVVDGKEGKHYPSRGRRPPIFSPDSQRLAYVARTGFKEVEFVVVDGQEEKRYDWIRERSLVFSPDSRRFAYIAPVRTLRLGVIKVGKCHMVVINGQEGNQYDGILAPPEGGGIIFDSPSQLHYIARKGKTFFLVDERLT